MAVSPVVVGATLNSLHATQMNHWLMSRVSSNKTRASHHFLREVLTRYFLIFSFSISSICFSSLIRFSSSRSSQPSSAPEVSSSNYCFQTRHRSSPIPELLATSETLFMALLVYQCNRIPLKVFHVVISQRVIAFYIFNSVSEFSRPTSLGRFKNCPKYLSYSAGLNFSNAPK